MITVMALMIGAAVTLSPPEYGNVRAAVTLTVYPATVTLPSPAPFAITAVTSNNTGTVNSDANSTATLHVSVRTNPAGPTLTDAAQGVSIPLTQLNISSTVLGTIHPTAADQDIYTFNRPRKNTNYNFAFNLTLNLTGDEAWGNYSLGLILTAALI